MTSPILFRWTGEVMQPVSRFIKACNLRFVVGEQYTLDEIKARSSASHNHYFACVEDAWQNLSEGQSQQFPTSEHLRKHALIACGYADVRSTVYSSKTDARRTAAFIRPMDTYAIVDVRECVVQVYTAQSQKKKAMGNKVFQESKSAVLEWVAALIEAKPEDLGKAA